MDKITLHGFPQSTYTRTACMAAAEKGIPYQMAPLAFGTPSHLALHPFGKMPVLTAGKLTLYETLPIVAYLDEAAAGPSLLGADKTARYSVLTCCSVAIDYAYGPLVRAHLGDEPPAGEVLAAAEQVADWAEARLERTTFLASDGLSAADLFLAPMLAFRGCLPGVASLTKGRATLGRWLESVTSRPSFAATEPAS